MELAPLKLIHILLAIHFNYTWAEPRTAHMYNWYDFIGPTTLKDFERKNCIVTTLDSFDSADVVQSKLMVGHTGYDVVVVGSEVLPDLIKTGVLQELNHIDLSNWSHLDPEVLAKVQSNDPGNRYAVPYLWGTTGIGYDKNKVEQLLGKNAPISSWDLIFKEENISKLNQCGVAMLDSPGELIPIALHYLGLPPNSQNPDDYNRAKALLLKIRPYVRYFDSSKFITDLANGNICAVVGWTDGVYEAQINSEHTKNGRKTLYSIPREGAPIWIENLVLLKNAQNFEHGKALINLLLRPEIIANISNYLGYPNANKDATALLDQKLRTNPMIYPSKEVMSTLFPIEPLPLPLERIRTRVWTKVKSGT